MSGADIGLVGLAVMGQNLVLNMADHGFRVAVYNRTEVATNEFAAGVGAANVAAGSIVPTSELGELVAAVERPRRIMLMVRAGSVVDAVIGQVAPLLDRGDVIIDGGNSLYTDTARRQESLEAQGLLYVGTGVSGGEEGARHGPSIMPGGSPGARELVEPIFEAIAARADDGAPCTAWLGPGGSGHFVKMVHNGIEYGDMQVLAEAYAVLSALGCDNQAMAEVFDRWRAGVLHSYLVDITAEILAATDGDGNAVIDQILDAAGQKGSGRWTVTTALELGQPLTLIGEAVMARQLSSLVDNRARAAGLLDGPDGRITDGQLSIDDIELAVYGSKIISYAQGFMLLAEASAEFGWDLDLGVVASIWRAGCIIRARFLDDITEAYRRSSDLANLVLDEFFADALATAHPAMRRVVAVAVSAGVPVPAYSSALAFYDGFRSGRLPANLIQAQRDYFGAHTYERIDRPRGEFFHTDWTGSGGPTTSTSYDA
ncbi:MAG: decarboxylating NADP(+)-dependent phosphogluconate dehydrogenase [Acidimicrobiia bacterium]|nr:decarboxylating NADP(+)-dependent phosphogluconate dehydrogenase [Acidimicrobiia bacterium]